MNLFLNPFLILLAPEGDAPPAGGNTPPAGDNAPAGQGSPPAGQAGPLLDAQGNFTKDWNKSLGVSDALGAKFSSPKALAASYESLEKMISAKGIIKPSATASPEEWNKYYTDLGRPASAKEYGYDKAIEKITVDGKEIAVPKELWDGANAAKFGDLAHKLGLTKEQAQAVIEFDLQRGMGAKENFERLMGEGKASGKAALEKAWGKDFEANLKAAQTAAATLGMTAEEMADPSIGNNPAFLKAMAKVAAMTKEAPAAGARGEGQPFSGDPRKEAMKIMNDPNDLWQPKFAQTDPAGHKSRVAYVKDLYAKANG